MIIDLSNKEKVTKLPKIESFSENEIQHFHNFMKEEGHNGHIRYFESGHYLLAHRLMFHWTIKRGAVGCYTGYEDRFCLPTEEICLDALKNWNNPEEDCPGQWHRHPNTGRRRVWAKDGTFTETIIW